MLTRSKIAIVEFVNGLQMFWDLLFGVTLFDGEAAKVDKTEILMGCAQTAAVGDPKVVGLLFF